MQKVSKSVVFQRLAWKKLKKRVAINHKNGKTAPFFEKKVIGKISESIIFVPKKKQFGCKKLKKLETLDGGGTSLQTPSSLLALRFACQGMPMRDF